MDNVVAINETIYNILKNRDFDGFMIIELTNAIMTVNSSMTDKQQVRKFVYRHVYSLLNKGYLVKKSSTGSRSAKYFKSELFKTTQFEPSKRSRLLKGRPVPYVPMAEQNQEPFWTVLNRERSVCEADLKIVLGEVEEFKRLISQYPAQAKLIDPLFIQARDQSIELLGKVNALTKLVNLQC